MNEKRQLSPRELSDALIREGMENTTTGNWTYSFEEINERYGTDLPADEKLMDAISHRLYDQSDSVADFCISEEGVELDFYYGQCPNYCGEDEDIHGGRHSAADVEGGKTNGTQCFTQAQGCRNRSAAL